MFNMTLISQPPLLNILQGIYLFVTNLTPIAISSKRKRNVQILPVMSPCETKNVMSSRRGILPLITAGSHHGVG